MAMGSKVWTGKLEVAIPAIIVIIGRVYIGYFLGIFFLSPESCDFTPDGCERLADECVYPSLQVCHKEKKRKFTNISDGIIHDSRRSGRNRIGDKGRELAAGSLIATPPHTQKRGT